MRDKVYAALVAKHPTISKHYLGLLATQIAKTVTEEDGIEASITAFETHISIPELATDFQKEQDRLVGLAEKKWKKENPPKDPANPNEPAKVDPPKDDTPEWAKSLISEVQSLKAEKLQTTITSKIQANEKLKTIPAKYYAKRKMPEKEEDIEAFVDEVVTDYADFEQDLANNGLSTTVKPVVVNNADGKEKVSAEMQAYLAEKNKTVVTKN